MNENQTDSLLRQAAHIPLPPGLAERLEAHIDRLASPPKARRHSLPYWAAAAAVAAVVSIAVFLPLGNKPPTDTFTDPYEAAIAAQQVLAFLSTELNKGLDQVSSAGEEIEKANQIVYQHLK